MCGFGVSLDRRSHGSRGKPWALDALRHRGSDGECVVVEDGLVLEHCRLAIIDPLNPDAAQPFADPTGRWTIVYNGEIFNFRAIRRDLERRGVTFRTDSDTEVLLMGFILDGVEILQRLRGMFAFVVWDRATGELFAARDQVGVKPFYYYADDDWFLAASEVRALLAHPAIAPRLDPDGVVEFLSFGNNLGTRTIVDGVRPLPAGHLLTLRGGRLEVREYWDVLSSSRPAELSHEQYVEDLVLLLDESVAASLVSDVPLGLMLSGGIDSSLVACLAARHVAGADITAYSVAFGRHDDEVEAAARLAADLGMHHRIVPVSESDVESDLDPWLRQLDYPTGNPTWIAASFVARAARADGIKVLLAGDGGDELFGGYSRWMKYLRFHRHVWSRVPSAVRSLVGRSAGWRVGGLAADIARRAAAGDGLYVPSRTLHDDALRLALGPRGLAALASRHPETDVRALRGRFDERCPGGDYLAWMSYAALKTSLVEDFLARLDKMGMRHGVEGRVPLLDPVLARWSLELPQSTKVPGLRQKQLLRDAAARILPQYVLERPKQGFCAPVGAWCDRFLADRGISADNPLFESGLVRSGAFDDLRAGGHSGGFAAWTLGVLAEWTALHLTGSATPLEVAAR